MKLVSALAVSTALVSATAQSAPAAIKPLIVGGTEVPVGEKTWMVGLREEFDARSRCGGMLIAPTKVLSAAHCRKFSYAAVGTHFKVNGTDGEQIKIVDELIHPKYNEPDDNSATWDYKILTLEKPASAAPVPILLNDPTQAPFPGKYATAIGWGNMQEEDGTHFSSSNVLLRVDVQIRTMEQCAALGMAPLDETMVCAGGVEGEDTCNGDSGGPLFLETSLGDAIIGIVSWGNGCARKDQPGVYARVWTVLDWITEHAPDAKFMLYPDN